MQQPATPTPSILNEDRCDLVARLKPGSHDLALPLYSIDQKNTHKHDDAVGWLDTGDGFLVYTAITDVGTRAKFVTKHLPRKYELQVPDKHKSSLKTGKHNAITLSYWTDGTRVLEPELRYGTIHTTKYNHKELPDAVREELLTLTGQKSSQAGIEQLMTTYNSILARTCAQQGISIPYYNKSNGLKEFRAEPVVHEHLGQIYTLSTSPLEYTIDLVSNLQIGKLLSGKGTVRNRKTMQRFCEHFTQKVQQDALRNQKAA